MLFLQKTVTKKIMKTSKINVNKYPKVYLFTKTTMAIFVYILNSAKCNGIITFVLSQKIKDETHFEQILVKSI